MKIGRVGYRGFTLIELLVAITIFAVGLLAVAGMQFNAIHYDSHANTNVVGEAVAHGVLAEILSRDSSDPIFDGNATPLTYADPDGNTILTAGASGQGSGTYTATYIVTLDGTSGATVAVEVTSSSDPPRTFSLTGYKGFL